LYIGEISMTAITIKVCADEWKTLPWKDFQKVLFRLQHRIYKAAKNDDYNLVKRLQNLLIGSKSSKYLAVRQITQLNAGRKTAGIDGKNSLNPKERLQLVDDLNGMKDWKHQKLRRVYILKSDGKRKRPLGIPTIKDRAMQCLIKYALEPVYEAYASDGAFGSRPGHSTWDIQNRLFQNLKRSADGSEKTILEVDIECCFDEIDHNAMLSRVTLPGVAKRFLRTALRAGVLKERDKTLKGTPQGGVISPLLCNIALHGIENLNNEWAYSRWYQRGFRYVDDMVFILKPGECQETLLNKVKDFLQVRGMKVSEAKTRFTSPLSGFDFLGWHFKVRAKHKKFVCYPSSKNRKQLIKKVKDALKDTKYNIQDRLDKIKTMYRGWWNYHQYCDMQQINLWSIREWVYQYVKKSTNMSGKEIIEQMQSIFNGHTYRVNRYSAISGKLSVYDGNFVFWSKRNSKLYRGPLATILKSQGYRCKSCGLRFMANDWVELHHKNGNNSDFKLSNLEALHRHCHNYQVVHRHILSQRKRR
jgi:group II intron reverse transcriptase/maturase